MSSLICPVAIIEKVLPHINADTLELVHVLGWQIVVKKNQYHVGEKVVYFPPDTVLSIELSEQLGVTKYLNKQRIRCAKLRGESSFGLLLDVKDPEWHVGMNVAEYYPVSKYEPPIRTEQGDFEIEHALFVRYSEIENMRNFPEIFHEGEQIIATEKIHGTNCRVGMIDGVKMAGSMKLRRKEPENVASSVYWFPFSLPSVASLLEDLSKKYRQVILFGEVYGSKIQSLSYGLQNTLGFRAFDLLLDGNYQSWTQFYILCKKHNVEIVPVIPGLHTFSLESVKQSSSGTTFLMKNNPHIREGIVVKPVFERTDPKIGRVILKYLSDEYLLSKKTDYTEQ